MTRGMCRVTQWPIVDSGAYIPIVAVSILYAWKCTVAYIRDVIGLNKFCLIFISCSKSPFPD